MISEEEFIGKFETEHYAISKEYIDTQVPQIRLYFTKYTPPDPSATILIVHGFGEHSHRFKNVAHFFATNGFEVLTVDLRGFGYSGGARGCAEVRQLQNDVILILKRARQNLPAFIYAHSMGGLVVIKLLLEKSELNLSGCVITSPLLGLGKSIDFNWMKKQFISHFGDHLSDFIVGSQVNPTALTKRKQFMHSIFEDRHMLPFMSVKMAKHIFEAVEFVHKNGDNFRYPLIIFHGKKDTVTDPELSRNFIYGKVRPYKQFYLFPQGFHELQHDEQKDELLSRALQFIKSLPNSKNLGVISLHCIAKSKPSQNQKFKKILLLGVILVIIKYLRSRFVNK